MKKVWDFIMQDVANDNETKTAAVIMRLFALIMCVYFVFQNIILMVCRDWKLAAVSFLFLIGYVAGFYFTYLNRTQVTLNYMQVLTVVWILVYIYLLGWDCGVQHFLFVLLIFMFVTSYARVKQKVGVAVLLCTIRVCLYFYTKFNTPVMELTMVTSILFQVVNTVTIFTQMTVIIMLFSQDSLLMEKKLMDYNEKVRELASLDPLTGLYNRRAVLRYMENLEKETADGSLWFSVGIGDIDFFKRINDTYGHEAGDQVLRHVADTCRQYMRGCGKVARWGGEEFLFVFKNCNGDEAFMKLEELRILLGRQTILYGEEEIGITMTFGVEEHVGAGGIDEAVNSADKKLYMGKEQGRNRVVY